MRFRIEAEGIGPLVFRTVGHGNLGSNERNVWFFTENMVEGWNGTPDAREDAVSRSMSDGDLFPSRITQGARILTIHGRVFPRSHLEAQQAIDDVNALFGKKLTVTADIGSGDRSVTGYLAADPAPVLQAGGHVLSFDLIIKCPDPLKYSDWITFTQSGGSISVINGGNAPSYPKVHVEKSGDNPVTYMTLTYKGRQVTWSGSANSFDLDFADMVPSAGTVSIDNAFAIDPGQQTVTVSSNGVVTLYIRSAWR